LNVGLLGRNELEDALLAFPLAIRHVLQSRRVDQAGPRLGGAKRSATGLEYSDISSLTVPKLGAASSGTGEVGMGPLTTGFTRSPCALFVLRPILARRLEAVKFQVSLRAEPVEGAAEGAGEGGGESRLAGLGENEVVVSKEATESRLLLTAGSSRIARWYIYEEEDGQRAPGAVTNAELTSKASSIRSSCSSGSMGRSSSGGEGSSISDSAVEGSEGSACLGGRAGAALLIDLRLLGVPSRTRSPAASSTRKRSISRSLGSRAPSGDSTSLSSSEESDSGAVERSRLAVSTAGRSEVGDGAGAGAKGFATDGGASDASLVSASEGRRGYEKSFLRLLRAGGQGETRKGKDIRWGW